MKSKRNPNRTEQGGQLEVAWHDAPKVRELMCCLDQMKAIDADAAKSCQTFSFALQSLKFSQRLELWRATARLTQDHAWLQRTNISLQDSCVHLEHGVVRGIVFVSPGEMFCIEGVFFDASLNFINEGAALLAFTLEQLRARGVQQVKARVLEDDQARLDLFQRAGFTG